MTGEYIVSDRCVEVGLPGEDNLADAEGGLRGEAKEEEEEEEEEEEVAGGDLSR